MARETTAALPHLRPHADVAERVLLPDDPGAALRLAQALMTVPPKMLNHNRGLWGYSGPAADGALLTVQATGTGGPSAAIVVREIVALGGRRLVRVGTCVGLRQGEVVVADPVVGRDGTSAALGAAALVDAELSGRIVAPRAPVTSVDVLTGTGVEDYETAAVLAAAAALGVPAAAVLVSVTGDDDERHSQELAAGAIAAQAFGLGGSPGLAR